MQSPEVIKTIAWRSKYLLFLTLLCIISISKLLYINMLVIEIALRNKTVIGQTFRISTMCILLTTSLLEKKHRGQVSRHFCAGKSPVSPLYSLRCFNFPLPLSDFDCVNMLYVPQGLFRYRLMTTRLQLHASDESSVALAFSSWEGLCCNKMPWLHECRRPCVGSG